MDRGRCTGWCVDRQRGVHLERNRLPDKAGAQWLDLTGANLNQATGVQQTVKTVPGTSYRLKFSVGNVVNAGGPFGVSSAIDVQVDGVTLMTASHTGGSPVELSWKGFSLTFTATSSKTTIAFINADPLADNSNGLDGVSLTALAPKSACRRLIPRSAWPAA